MKNEPPEGERPLHLVLSDRTAAAADFLVESFSFTVVLTAFETGGSCHISMLERGDLSLCYMPSVVEALRVFAEGIEQALRRGEADPEPVGHA